MPHADLEPIGRLERVIQPTLRRFQLNAEMGVNTVLSPESAKAAAEAFNVLCRTIDLMEAEKEAVRQAIKGALCGLLLIAVLLAIAFL